MARLCGCEVWVALALSGTHGYGCLVTVWRIWRKQCQIQSGSRKDAPCISMMSHVYMDEGLREKWAKPYRQWWTWQALSRKESTQFVSIFSDRRLEMSRGVAALHSVSGFSPSHLEPCMAMLGAARLCGLPPLTEGAGMSLLGLRNVSGAVSACPGSVVWLASVYPLAIFLSKYTSENVWLISFEFWVPLPFPAL